MMQGFLSASVCLMTCRDSLCQNRTCLNLLAEALRPSCIPPMLIDCREGCMALRLIRSSLSRQTAYVF